MDEEQFERQKEFILQQQAQFAAKIGQLEDNVARLGGVVERLVGVVERMADSITQLAQATTARFEETDRKIAALVDAQIRNEEMVGKLGERIDNLTAAIERHISDGHGGRAETNS